MSNTRSDDEKVIVEYRKLLKDPTILKSVESVTKTKKQKQKTNSFPACWVKSDGRVVPTHTAGKVISLLLETNRPLQVSSLPSRLNVKPATLDILLKCLENAKLIKTRGESIIFTEKEVK